MNLNSDMPDIPDICDGDIVVILTGGTIASSSDGEKHDANSDGSKEAFLNSIRENVAAEDYSKLKIIDLFNMDSTDITPEHNVETARVLNEVYKRANIQGAMVIGGTNTAKYSISMLEVLTNENVDAIYVDAMRTPEEDNPDGMDNFNTALCAIVSGNAMDKGILLASNRDQIFCAFDCVKWCGNAPTEERVRSAFAAPIHKGPMITVNHTDGSVAVYYEPWRPEKSGLLSDENVKDFLSTRIGIAPKTLGFPGESMAQILCDTLDIVIVEADAGRFVSGEEAKMVEALIKAGKTVIVGNVNPEDEIGSLESYKRGNALDVTAIGAIATELDYSDVLALSRLAAFRYSDRKGFETVIPKTPISKTQWPDLSSVYQREASIHSPAEQNTVGATRPSLS